MSRRTVVATVLILVVIPLIIAAGIVLLADRQYYLVSVLVIVCTLAPFGMIFERRRPQARELVILAVLCAIGVAGRGAFFMLPQVKPVVAVVIIAGVTMGPEAGFLVGAMTGFVSNFFFGQGPWTPWQMFSFGIIGFLAGLVFGPRGLPARRVLLCAFGGLTTLVIYGALMNTASLLMWTAKPTWAGLIAMFASGLPFDLVHAVATVVFLWFVADPMIEKLHRVRRKYGLLTPEAPDPPRPVGTQAAAEL